MLNELPSINIVGPTCCPSPGSFVRFRVVSNASFTSQALQTITLLVFRAQKFKDRFYNINCTSNVLIFVCCERQWVGPFIYLFYWNSISVDCYQMLYISIQSDAENVPLKGLYSRRELLLTLHAPPALIWMKYFGIYGLEGVVHQVDKPDYTI